MTRPYADIEADIEAVQRRMALEDHLAKLREEQRISRERGYQIDLTADEEEPRVKAEQQEASEADVPEQNLVQGIHEHNVNGGHHILDHSTQNGPQRNGDMHYRTPSSRDMTLARPRHELRVPLDRGLQTEGPQEQLGGFHRPRVGFGAGYSRHGLSAVEQSYTGSSPEDVIPRAPAYEIPHWREDAPGRQSMYEIRDQFPKPSRKSFGAHGDGAPEPVPRHLQSFLDPQRMLEPGSTPGHMQPPQPGQQSRHHVPQQTQSGRQDMMGRPLHIIGQTAPVRADVPAVTPRVIEKNRFDKHPTFPTLIEKPDGTGYWELRCYVCEANVCRSSWRTQNGKSSGGQFLLGITGFRNHIQICHPAELDEEQKISTATIIERCTVRELGHPEVVDMQHKRKGAYKIDKKAGAGADAAAIVRQPHPWKKRKTGPEEDIKAEAKSRRTGAKSRMRDRKQKRTQPPAKRTSNKGKGKQPQSDVHDQGHQDQDDHDHDQDQNENHQDQIEHYQDDQNDSDYVPGVDDSRRLTSARTREQVNCPESVSAVEGDTRDLGEHSGVDVVQPGLTAKDAIPKETWSSRMEQGHE